MPSQRALLVNSEHNEPISTSLNFGSEVIFFQAVNTSIFFSLLAVLGNVASSPHGIVVAVSGIPIAKGEGSPSEMSSFSILERQGSFSGTDDELSGEGLFACAAEGSEEDEVGEVPELKEVAI